MINRADCVVIGAGVIGIAVARALAMAGREVLLLEREKLIGSITSARNSEVIHAGIYYPAGSLKAETCVEGRERLYAYCADRDVPHRRCGKLIVATEDGQRAALETIAAHAAANGVQDIRLIDAADVRNLEPELNAVAALHSPSTGIIDGHGYMHALLGDAENRNAMLALGTAVTALTRRPDGIDIHIEGEQEPVLRAHTVVNATGLDAQALAATMTGYTPPPLSLAKGNYFMLARRAPFSRLIYPVPEPGGLGIHLTLDLAGAARFGPDVEWIDQIDYDVDPGRAALFYPAIRTYWPGLRDGELFPAYAGIRPKIASHDFAIEATDGVIHLFGIESPGLTGSLAIADRVAALAAA